MLVQANLKAAHQNHETSLMMAGDENIAQMAQQNFPAEMEQHDPISTVDACPHVTSVSILLPRKNNISQDHHNIFLRRVTKRPTSIPSSRFSVRRLDLEVESMKSHAGADLQSKQQELER